MTWISAQALRIGRAIAVLLIFLTSVACAQDLDAIRERGVLRHLAVPYAHFVTGDGGGLEVDIIRLFAEHLGVRYESVPTTWERVIPDLIGQEIEYKPQVRAFGAHPIRGDIIANGYTILPARKQLIDYSRPTFPTAVWLIARSISTIQPIKPSGSLATDIAETKTRLSQGKTLVAKNSCIDPQLYNLHNAGYSLVYFASRDNFILNEIIPAIINGDAEMSLIDAPDLMVAMEKWPGLIKVIGPISEQQEMAAAFRKSSPALRKAFDDFLVQIQKDGRYMKLIDKYYRVAPRYFPAYFEQCTVGN